MKFFKGNHSEPIIVATFSVLVLRDTTVILKIKNAGQTFTENSKVQLKKVMAKDRILIYNIYGRDYGNELVFIGPIELAIE